MPAKLTPEQNQRIRKLAEEWAAKHKSPTEAARVAHVGQSWLSRVIDGKSGASLETATALCEAMGLNVTEVLGITPAITSWKDLPGYEEALAQARATLYHLKDEGIWNQVGRMIMPPHPDRVEPWMLIQLAQFVATLNAHTLPPAPAPPAKRSDYVRKQSAPRKRHE